MASGSKRPVIFDNWMTKKPPVPASSGNSGNQNAYRGKTVAYSSEQLQKMPILKNQANQDRFVTRVIQQMRLAQPERDARHARCSSIDIQLQGFQTLDKDDQKRRRELLTKGKVKPTDHNLPMADAQIDDAEAYLMSVFAPDMNIFESSAPVSKAEAAKALTEAINEQGQRAQYYRHFTKLCGDALRYNFAGITTYWEKTQGYVFSGGQTGALTKTQGIVWEGNAICTVDVYNFFYDTTVHPSDLPKKGEWFAEVDLITPFRAMKAQADGREFGIERFYDPVNNGLVQPKWMFYRPPPVVRRDEQNYAGEDVNWQMTLRAEAGPAQASAPGIERIRYVAWIVPKDWGFSQSKDMELWRIHIMQGCYITYAVRLDDSHGMLPVACTCPIENDLGTTQRTYAERLLPLQHFQSFLLNTHQAGVRKSLYGVTVYNQQLFPGLDLSKEDLTSATIPMRGSAQGIDIDKAFRHYNTAPSTDANVDMIEKVDAIMQKVLPTDVYRQVADLDRATLYQAAATVQTGNRRSLKIARMISTQCLEIVKMQMIYNIYANQKAIEYTDENGQDKTLSPAQFADLGLEKYISNGLKGIDRLMIIAAWNQVMTAVLQSQQAVQELDIVKMIAYFFNLAGQSVDMNSFRKPIQQQAAQAAIQNGQPSAATTTDANAAPAAPAQAA